MPASPRRAPSQGWASLVARAAGEHDVWVLTRENNVESIEHAIANHPFRSRIHIVGFDLAPTLLRLKKALRWGARTSTTSCGSDAFQPSRSPWTGCMTSTWSTMRRSPALDTYRGGIRPQAARRGPGRWLSRHTMETLARPWLRGLPGRSFAELGAPFSPVTGSRRASASASAVLIQNPGTFGACSTPTRVRLLPNGLIGALNGTSAGNPIPAPARVVFAGRLIGWKGPILAIEAMRFVEDPSITLDIYGSGPDLSRLRRVRPDAACCRGSVFHGSVPRELVLRAFAEAMALVHPALHEESSVTVGEAFSLGTPWCVSTSGAPRAQSYWPDIPSRVVSPSIPDVRPVKSLRLSSVWLASWPTGPAPGQLLSKGCWTHIDSQSGPGGLHEEVSPGLVDAAFVSVLNGLLSLSTDCQAYDPELEDAEITRKPDGANVFES